MGALASSLPSLSPVCGSRLAPRTPTPTPALHLKKTLQPAPQLSDTLHDKVDTKKGKKAFEGRIFDELQDIGLDRSQWREMGDVTGGRSSRSSKVQHALRIDVPLTNERKLALANILAKHDTLNKLSFDNFFFIFRSGTLALRDLQFNYMMKQPQDGDIAIVRAIWRRKRARRHVLKRIILPHLNFSRKSLRAKEGQPGIIRIKKGCGGPEYHYEIDVLVHLLDHRFARRLHGEPDGIACALRNAAALGKDGAVRIIINAMSRKHLNIPDQHGWTALMHAAARKHIAVVKALVYAGATEGMEEVNVAAQALIKFKLFDMAIEEERVRAAQKVC